MWNPFYRAFLKTEVSRPCNSWHISVGWGGGGGCCHGDAGREKGGRKEAMEDYAQPGCRFLHFAQGEPCLPPAGWVQAQAGNLLLVPPQRQTQDLRLMWLMDSDVSCLLICVHLLYTKEHFPQRLINAGCTLSSSRSMEMFGYFPLTMYSKCLVCTGDATVTSFERMQQRGIGMSNIKFPQIAHIWKRLVRHSWGLLKRQAAKNFVMIE